MQHIMIVEDEPEIARWIERLAGEVFPAASFTAASTLQQARQGFPPLPELLLTDLSLPDGKGFELIAELKQHQAALPCIVITSFEDDDFLFPALQAGADGYLLKDQQDEELIQLMLGILDGKPPISPNIAHRLFKHFRQFSGQSCPNESQLTQRETETLQYIARGYSTKECARKMAISPYTVSDHIKEIYRKLHINSRAEAAREAAKLGID